MHTNRMTAKEYRNAINRVLHTRQACAVRKDNSETKTRESAIQKVQKLRGSGQVGLQTGPFRAEVEIHGQTRADIDNILKGILDALNGVAYQDDRQCVEARVKLCESEIDL